MRALYPVTACFQNPGVRLIQALRLRTKPPTWNVSFAAAIEGTAEITPLLPLVAIYEYSPSALACAGNRAFAVSAALDEAWRQVEADKITYKVDGNAQGARNTLAKSIVDMAKRGKRDPQRLTLGALARLRL